MYNPQENRIIIDGEDKTDSVERCWYTSRPNRCQVIFCNFPKTYSYVPSKVLWLKDPMVFDPQHCHLLPQRPPDRASLLHRRLPTKARGDSGTWNTPMAPEPTTRGADVELVRSCLEETPAQDRFAYLRDVAELNP